MSEMRSLRDKLKNCYLNGFFLDRNTFLKADDAYFVMALRRQDDGRVADRPMVILKNVVEMTIHHKGRIVDVENRPQLGVWVDAVERAIERFNK